MEIIGQGIVFAGEKETDHQSCAFPGVAVLPAGRWLCGFRAAPTKKGTNLQHALIALSDDQGKSWDISPDPLIPPRVESSPGLFRAAYLTPLGGQRVLAALCWVDDSDPSLPFFNESTEGLLDTRIFFALSGDGGATWSEPTLMDTSPFNVPTPLTGPVLILPDGRWACQFELNKHYYDRSPWRHSSILMFSADGGKSWPDYTAVSHDPGNRFFYWDQRPAVLANGAVLNLFWTYDSREAAYRNIHAKESLDSGRTWSELWDTGVPGQPAQPVSLPGGRIAMVRVDRSGTPAVKLRLSSDGGRTWPAGGEATLHEPRLGSQTLVKTSMSETWTEMENFSLGLPAATALPGGDILVVYYAGPDPDLTDIRWMRIRP